MSTIAIGAHRQMRVISALLIREVRLRNSKHAFMQLFDLLEAVFYIVSHFLIFKFTGRHLIIGDSLLTWITTGVFPVLYFRAISIRTASAISASRSLASIPYISPIDYAIARSMIEMLAFCFMFSAFLAIVYMLGASNDAVPFDAEPVLLAVGLLTIFAFGMGMVNSFILYLFPLWKFIWQIFSRVQIFMSAVFFIPEYSLPPNYRNIVEYNPTLQFVSLFRTGFYRSYPSHYISLPYILSWTFGALLIGMALEKVLRDHRLMMDV